MRPKICVPIVAPLRDGIIREAKQIAKLPVEMVEWRIDFFAGYGREILDVITELKRVLNEKELLVTIRTVAEGGEENGFRFDYFETIRKILEQQTADYVDVEAARDEEEVKALCQKYSNTKTKVIGSYHDFSKTPSVDEIKESAALDTDLKTWANAQSWKLSDESDVEISNVEYDFDPDHITAGTYQVTFSTQGREFKIHTTDIAEEGAEVGLTFFPEDIHVMSKMGF